MSSLTTTPPKTRLISSTVNGLFRLNFSTDNFAIIGQYRVKELFVKFSLTFRNIHSQL